MVEATEVAKNMVIALTLSLGGNSAPSLVDKLHNPGFLQLPVTQEFLNAAFAPESKPWKPQQTSGQSPAEKIAAAQNQRKAVSSDHVLHLKTNRSSAQVFASTGNPMFVKRG